MTQSEAIAIIGLPVVFTALEAKKAYRAAARTAHPDKGGTHEKMKELNKAYRLICAGLDFGPAPKIDVGGVEFKTKKQKPSVRTVVTWFSEQMYRRVRNGFWWRKKTGYELFRLLRKECTVWSNDVRSFSSLFSEAATPSLSFCKSFSFLESSPVFFWISS